MKEIPLTKGYVARVDSEDYDLVRQYVWRSQTIKDSDRVYAVTGNHPNVIYLHRLVSGASAGELVDHVDADGLNNSRANLRLCSHTQNMQNRRPNRTSSSGFKGVYFCPARGKWAAEIKANKGRLWIGRFDSPLEAAQAYDAKARELHGEFARTNFS